MSKPKTSVKRVVLAYSGGLDTSIILKWLQTTYGCEVVTFTADLGQGEELGPAREKEADDLPVTPGGRAQESRAAVVRARVAVGAALEEKRDRLRVPVRGGENQGGRARLVPDVDEDAALKQDPGRLRATEGGRVQELRTSGHGIGTGAAFHFMSL